MKYRLLELLEEGVAIVRAMEDPDNDAWIAQALAAISILQAKLALSQARHELLALTVTSPRLRLRRHRRAK
jgi:hypothetical protein